ncbi:MAG: GNAT family N-acetyltransferase [Pseudomonadota bacterium]
MVFRPYQVGSDSVQIPLILDLIRQAFAYMEGRIDPPSSMLRLDVGSIRTHCETGEVWAIGTPPQACIFLTWKPDRLYLGKLAVSPAVQGQGLGRQMIEVAARRARETGVGVLELETRVELTENHSAFARLGFEKTAETAHPGYDRPTSITMQRQI